MNKFGKDSCAGSSTAPGAAGSYPQLRDLLLLVGFLLQDCIQLLLQRLQVALEFVLRERNTSQASLAQAVPSFLSSFGPYLHGRAETRFQTTFRKRSFWKLVLIRKPKPMPHSGWGTSANARSTVTKRKLFNVWLEPSYRHPAGLGSGPREGSVLLKSAQT